MTTTERKVPPARLAKPSRGWITRRVLDIAGGVVATTLVLTVAVSGFGQLPALGDTFNPGTGVWHISPDAIEISSGQHRIPGMTQPGTVRFEANGFPHVVAASDDDLWRMIGYVHASFRLLQMDLARRQGSGSLAEILGPDALEADIFELDIGVRRAAERDWNEMRDGAPKRALLAYAAGVNTAIDKLIAAHQLPTAFKLLGYTPAPWTPVDTLMIQRLMTQTASLSDAALTHSYPARTMDPAAFLAFLPESPVIDNHPYDKGPYLKAPLAPAPVRADPAGSAPADGVAAPAPEATATALRSPADLDPLLTRLAKLPGAEMYGLGGSNAFAVSGARTASGKAMLAADPHLEFTLPAVWFQLEGTSPGYHFAGATVPGIPVPIIGRTDAFSWAVTTAQHPTTLYYLETTDAEHPDQYYWRGAWRPMETIDYQVAVRGAPVVRHTTRLTAHGPVLQMQGLTVAVWWPGTLSSPQTGSFMSALQAQDFAGFRESFRNWGSPALNVVYADRAGNIGAFGTGTSPQVDGHDIAMPLPGDGSADVSGAIPFEAMPHTYNPPSGYVISSNQNEVTKDYPYQYATTFNFPDQGWRAGEIERLLNASERLTAADLQRIQNDQHDPLLAQLLPHLVTALADEPLTPTERSAATALASWDADTGVDSVPASIMANLAEHLVYVVFQPWWAHFKVPVDPRGRNDLWKYDGPAIPNLILQATLLNWIEHDPTNKYLTAPGGPTRDAAAVLRQTFHETISHMIEQNGPDVDGWAYGKRHTVLFESLLRSPPLSVGPVTRGGTPRTINAAAGTWRRDGIRVPEVSKGGASYRIVMDWATDTASCVIPGGQSESTLSPWYDNGIDPWMKGELWPMRYGAQLTDAMTPTIWRFSS